MIRMDTQFILKVRRTHPRNRNSPRPISELIISTCQKVPEWLTCKPSSRASEDDLLMNIGETIKNFRLQKGMSQGDIEKRTGLLRCYLSRVENGHTIPSLDTLA